MAGFQGIRKTLHFTQAHSARREEVFPLLCPVREADWLEGWEYTLLFSESGLIEEGCVFTTPHHGPEPTTWYVVAYDPERFTVTFLRVTPGLLAVRIGIALEESAEQTFSKITYAYTGLSETGNHYIRSELDADFQASMHWWESALNHYLETGEMLHREIVTRKS